MRKRAVGFRCIAIASGLAALGGFFAVPPAMAAQRPYVLQRSAVSVASVPARLLASHNIERAQRRLPPLAWDPGLAAGAAAYAGYLAATGTFQHSNRQARRGVGENLWMGTAGAFSPEQMIGSWVSEKQWFFPGIFPNVSRSGGWAAVAHYTQIIWPTTSRVGCAIAHGRGREYLVCRYSPAGNIDGRPVG